MIDIVFCNISIALHCISPSMIIELLNRSSFYFCTCLLLPCYLDDFCLIITRIGIHIMVCCICEEFIWRRVKMISFTRSPLFLITTVLSNIVPYALECLCFWRSSVTKSIFGGIQKPSYTKFISITIIFFSFFVITFVSWMIFFSCWLLRSSWWHFA